MTKKLKELMQRVEGWPTNAQEEAMESLLAIEEGYIPYRLSDDDREALQRSEEDVRLGRFADDEEVAKLYDLYHGT